MTGRGAYRIARQQLISFLEDHGFASHPSEVFCPPAIDPCSTSLTQFFRVHHEIGLKVASMPLHYWVDVAARKDQDYWAFEYKSRNDSMKRGFDQCCAYSSGFNYVVLVADRLRLTKSDYFTRFKRQGFGVWRHDGARFYSILPAKRRTASTNANAAIRKQFQHAFAEERGYNTRLTEWLPTLSRLTPVTPCKN